MQHEQSVARQRVLKPLWRGVIRPLSTTNERWAVVSIALVVTLGAFVRIVQFASGRSLWHDEAALALNVMSRSPGELLGKLDFGQAAPPAFLLAEWSVSTLAGYSEDVLRIVPLLSGIATITLFAMLARRVLGPWAAVGAVLSVAIADGLISYSAELKPYSTDALVTVVFVTLGVTALDSRLTARQGVLLGAAGAIAATWSFASVFVATSIAAVLIVVARRGRWQLLIPAGAWCFASAAVVLYARPRTTQFVEGFRANDSSSIGAGATGVAESQSWIERLTQPLDVLGTAIFHGLGLAQDRPLSHLTKVAAVVMILGLVGLARRRAAIAAMVVLPIVVTLSAYELDLYPITLRTSLFLVPLAALLLGEGFSQVASLAVGRGGSLLALATATVVLGFPVYSAISYVSEPRTHEELRPVLATLLREWESGDTLYLDSGARYAFRYYAECGCLDANGRTLDELVPFTPSNGTDAVVPRSRALVVGSDLGSNPGKLESELSQLRGRVWYVYSHTDDEREERFLQVQVPRVLDRRGVRLDVVRRPGAAALLYDLR